MSGPDLKPIASRLARRPVREVVAVSGGGNSRVYMVAAEDKLFAMKQYPDIKNDKRNRLETERHALELMHWHGIRSIPEWLSCEEHFALMSWVDGSLVKDPAPADIDEAAVFLATLHHISGKTPAADMPLASEACLCGQNIIDQLERRMEALMPYTKENPALMKFLSGRFMPAFASRLKAAKKAVPAFAEELPQKERTLIAADFGFHNILRTVDSQLVFIDFEYFGWDDPVKLMSDFLLHPATALPAALKTQFYGHMLAIYGDAIAARFASFYPLFGLRWALILLNEFIPERWQARASAKGLTDWEQVKTEQLAKAESMLAQSEKF